MHNGAKQMVIYTRTEFCSFLKYVIYCCGLAVIIAAHKMGKAGNFYTLSTNRNYYLSKRAIILHKISTAFCYLSAAFTQFYYFLVLSLFYTLSTEPINTTKLIKD
jgi:hypothetical protein